MRQLHESMAILKTLQDTQRSTLDAGVLVQLQIAISKLEQHRDALNEVELGNRKQSPRRFLVPLLTFAAAFLVQLLSKLFGDQ